MWPDGLIIRFVDEKNKSSIRDLTAWSRSICWFHFYTNQTVCLLCSLTTNIHFRRFVCVIKSFLSWFSIAKKSFFESNAWKKKLKSTFSRIENYKTRSKTNFMISQKFISMLTKLKSKNFDSCYENAQFKYNQKAYQQSRHF